MGLAPRVRVRRTTFADAIEATIHTRRHLLLGNGFSIAAHPAFAYGSLLEAAGEMPARLSGVFEQLGTTDFEAALNFLNQAEAVLALYDADRPLVRLFRRDAEALKAHLIAAITAVHPATAVEIADEASVACRDFLALFTAPERDRRGRVFTTNYDLLLYWVMVRHSEDLRCDDGFRGRLLTWNAERVPGQSLFFLHGGLHLYEANGELRKLQFRQNASLLDQIRTRLEADEEPLFVSEGSSVQKLQRIAESEYLRTAHRAFRRACRGRESVLFTIGHALGEQDRHITDAIGLGRISRVYIGAYGGLNSEDGIRARTLAGRWANLREESAAGVEERDPFPLEIHVFDSAGCEIWEQL